MLVHHLLEHAANHSPDKDAVWYNDKWYSYQEVNESAEKIASYLINRGIEKGDRVAILYENSLNCIAAYFGVLKAGAVVTGLNTNTNTETIIYLLNNSEAKAIISNRKYSKYLLPVLVKCPYLKEVIINQEDLSRYKEIDHCHFISLSIVYNNNSKREVVQSVNTDLAEIVYTSGSTGKPKGVMLTHLNLVSNMRSICNYLHLTKDDRIMVVLPFHYIYGKSLLLTHFLVGGSVVIDNQFVFPNKVLETMKKTKVTGFAGVPSTFMILLNRSNLKDIFIESLRYVTQAGGAMAPEIQKAVVKVFNPALVYVMYGTTEASPRLSYLKPEHLIRKWGSIGVPVDRVDLLIVDSEGNELPGGEEGEIAAKGPNIMKGYWKDPKETANVLKNGMYFTGDIGKQDEEGFFYITGRSKDIIKVKGFRVGAKEIEEAILEITEVHETAVIGVEDPFLGEAVMALIIPKDRDWSNSGEIMQYLKKKLPPLKLPKYIKFRDSFPKNESGKILKIKLKEEEIKRLKK